MTVPGYGGKLSLEYHGIYNRKHAKFDVYSNDGQFVNSPWDLNTNGRQDETAKASFENLDGGPWPTGDKPDLGTFLSNMNKTMSGKTVNFWRPAYNLYRTPSNVAATANPEYQYNKTQLVTRLGSDGFGKDATFNALEQQMVRILLGLDTK